MAYAVDFTNILDQSTWEYGVEKEFKFYGVLKAIQLDASNTVTVDGSTYTINSSPSHSPIYEPISQWTQSAYEKGCIFFSLIKGDNVLYNRISTNMNQFRLSMILFNFVGTKVLPIYYLYNRYFLSLH